MTTKVNMNGQARKSLAEQIDRLDNMLDGLADGLNDAVAAAVKDAVGMAVQQAVQTMMREMLTNPEMPGSFRRRRASRNGRPRKGAEGESKLEAALVWGMQHCSDASEGGVWLVRSPA